MNERVIGHSICTFRLLRYCNSNLYPFLKHANSRCCETKLAGFIPIVTEMITVKLGFKVYCDLFIKALRNAELHYGNNKVQCHIFR